MTETITLGGRRFELRPLTLGELRPLLDALDAFSGAGGAAMLDGAGRVIHAGCKPAEPGLRLDDILGLAATMDEVNAAVAAVLRVAGLVRPGEADPRATPGEVPAFEPSSAAFTARSPPAAAIPTAPSTA